MEMMMNNSMGNYGNTKKQTLKEEEKEEACVLNRRRWDNLDRNLLLQIFERISHDRLFINISSVCRAWQAACWEILYWKSDYIDLSYFPNFSNKLGPSMEYSEMEIKGMKLIKSILEGDVAHGTPVKGWIQSVSAFLFPDDFHISNRILLFIAERTPNLNCICLRSSDRLTQFGFLRAITYWKEAKFLLLGSIAGGCYTNIFQAIGKNCCKLEHLCIHDQNFKLDEANSISIAKELAGLQVLGLVSCCIFEAGMEIVFNQCRELKIVRIEHCLLIREELAKTTICSAAAVRRKVGSKDDFEWLFY